jgi:NADH:ubiquinone oxidoreductase subunit 6 (subunit J)
MDTTTAIGSVLAAFGLSGAAGLNPWLPLFASALLHRLDLVELGAPFDELSSSGWLAALGVLMSLDFVGDKVPAVDHALHAIGTIVAPASGAALFVGQTGLETDLPTLAAIVLGALTAGSIHLARASVRPASTAATGGLGNPVLSFVEDVGAGLLTAIAFLLPVLAVVLLLALVAALLTGWRRLRRALAPGPRSKRRR